MKNFSLKKTCVVLLLICAVSLLGADTPRRMFEFGVDAGLGLSNNYFRLRDILRKTVPIDIPELSENLSHGLKGHGDLQGGLFFNFEMPDKFGIGIFSRADAMAHAYLPQSLLDMLAQGNEPGKKHNGNFGMGAASFSEVGFRTSFVFNKLGGLRFSLQPACYIPVHYIQKPSAEYSLKKNSNMVHVEGNYAMSIYSAYSLENYDGLTARPGFDLSLFLEYPLLSSLTLGASFNNIPMFPAELRNRMLLEGNFAFDTNDLMTQLQSDGSILSNTTQTHDKNRVTLRRPFKASLNAVYRPLGNHVFSLIPSLGITANSIYDVPVYVDAGLGAEVNVKDVLILNLGSHYEDLVWKQRLALALNFHAFELDLGVSMESPEFLKSFQGKGLGASVGVRIGW
jgi:hypothetical protein